MSINKFSKFEIFIFSFLFILLYDTSAQNKNYKGAEVYGKSPYYVLYGKIEVRMMAAKGGGILSTLFTWKEGSEQSNVFWEEIDVEIFGKNDAATWQSNIITGFDPRKTSEQVHTHSSSLADEFHTYAVEWTPESVAWYFDGQLVRENSSPEAADLKSPAGIRFNLWASTSTSWAGAWNDNLLPQYQFVNWIKYYRYENDEFVLDWYDDFTSFNSERWGKANWTFDGNRVDFDPQNILVQDGMLILCLTKAGETGFTGVVPQDSADISTDIHENINSTTDFSLYQNYPNPFNPSTRIEYTIPKSEVRGQRSEVRLVVYDILGREVATLVNERQKPDNYEVDFNGEELGSGIYLCHLRVGDFAMTRKMLLLK